MRAWPAWRPATTVVWEEGGVLVGWWAWNDGVEEGRWCPGGMVSWKEQWWSWHADILEGAVVVVLEQALAGRAEASSAFRGPQLSPCGNWRGWQGHVSQRLQMARRESKRFLQYGGFHAAEGEICCWPRSRLARCRRGWPRRCPAGQRGPGCWRAPCAALGCFSGAALILPCSKQRTKSILLPRQAHSIMC